MAKVVFTPNVQRHVALPEPEATKLSTDRVGFAIFASEFITLLGGAVSRDVNPQMLRPCWVLAF
jgi:hypothetical protein